MKGYRTFLFVFVVLFTIYIIAEVNKPAPINWKVTLSKDDKNPFGGFILYQRLKDLFRNAAVQSFRLPVYNRLNNYTDSNSAYIIVSQSSNFSKDDWEKISDYVAAGNYIFLSSNDFNNVVSKSLGFKTLSRVSPLKRDSTSLNFINPRLRRAGNYVFRKYAVDEYFSEIDTIRSIILGVNNYNDANFLKITSGKGAFFIHANPLCFSNYFMVFQNNAEYVAKALSYLPDNVQTIFWDEYYKLGPAGASTPLRFFLLNRFMLWALRLSLAGLLIYIFFESKRRQRIIPVINPLQNSTLDFVKTVAAVYFNHKDNNSIVHKKVSYFLEFVRQHFYLQTQQIDSDFVEQLSKKSGVEKEKTQQLVLLIEEIEKGYPVSDKLLLLLDEYIDNFYKQVK